MTNDCSVMPVWPLKVTCRMVFLLKPAFCHKLGVTVTVKPEPLSTTTRFGYGEGGFGWLLSSSPIQPSGGFCVPSNCAKKGVALESGQRGTLPEGFCPLPELPPSFTRVANRGTTKKRHTTKEYSSLLEGRAIQNPLFIHCEVRRKDRG